jgi:outer membrane protein assembly factor BamB
MRATIIIALLSVLSAAALMNCGAVACDTSDDASFADDGTADDAGDDAKAIDANDATADAATACPARVATGTQSTAYRVDATHVGVQPADSVALPLCLRWSRDFVGDAAPLVVAGRALAFDRGDLYAVDLDTGATIWGPTPLLGQQMATDGASVYVESAAGYVVALDVADGHVLWEAPTPAGAVPGVMVTVSDGRVVIWTPLGAYALDASTGARAWQSPTNQYCGPGATIDGIAYIPCDCDANTAISVATGAIVWAHTPDSNCAEPSSSEPLAATPSGLYDPGVTGMVTIDATNGNATAHAVQGWLGPAVSNQAVFNATLVQFEAWTLDLGQQIWAFQGDGQPTAAPLVVGSDVVEMTSKTLYVLGAGDGKLLDTRAIPDAGGARAALADADGVLLAATVNGLFAY